MWIPQTDVPKSRRTPFGFSSQPTGRRRANAVLGMLVTSRTAFSPVHDVSRFDLERLAPKCCSLNEVQLQNKARAERAAGQDTARAMIIRLQLSVAPMTGVVSPDVV